MNKARKIAKDAGINYVYAHNGDWITSCPNCHKQVINRNKENGFKLSFFQKAAIAPLLKVVEKGGITTIVLTPDKAAEMGFKVDFYIKPVKVMTVDEFENLKEMCKLMDEIDTAIKEVAWEYRNRNEYSVKRAFEYADNFFKTSGIGIEIEK